MSTQPAITIDGDERLVSTARHAADELRDMDTANRAVGEIVRSRAASNAPKVSGRLAGSVVVASVSDAEVVIAATEIYAPPINYGWAARNIVAQPFMSNALGDTQSALVDIYGHRVNDAVSHIKGA